jgi:hypothetical protein
MINGPIQRTTNKFVNNYYVFALVERVTALAIVREIINGPHRSPNL